MNHNSSLSVALHVPNYVPATSTVSTSGPEKSFIAVHRSLSLFVSSGVVFSNISCDRS